MQSQLVGYRRSIIDYLQDQCKLGHGGRLGYIDAISEMIDFRKLHGASEAVFQKFSATELYLKRARKTVAKMMRLQWTQDLDIETLEARGQATGQQWRNCWKS